MADGQVDLGVPRVEQVVEVGRVDLGVALVPVEEGDLELVEEEKPVHCRKCRKVSYRAKNGEFCEALCSVETAMEPIEDEAAMEEATTEEEVRTAPDHHNSVIRFLSTIL